MTDLDAIRKRLADHSWDGFAGAGADIAALLAEVDRYRSALTAMLDTQYTVSVSGHDVECDLIQTSGLPCSCGKNDAIRVARAALDRGTG